MTCRYLRATAAIARSGRPGEYVVVFFRSGFFRTDLLGVRAIRALINGKSDVEAMDLVERIEAGAAARALELIDQMDASGAMSAEPIGAAGRGRHLRRLLARILGWALNVVGPIVRSVPALTLLWIFKVLPNSPTTGLVWRSRRSAILHNLRTSGYSRRSEVWLRNIGRACSAFPPANGLFQYLSLVIPAPRLDRLVRGLIDDRSAHELAGRLESTGAMVGVFLHGPLSVAVPNAIRSRGGSVVRTITGHSHGIHVSQRSGPLSNFFGDPSDSAVEVVDALATADLVRHLKAGRSVYIALERLPGKRTAAEIEILQHRFPRNDGPAWLAVRAGRPIALWTTHRSRARVVITCSELLQPDPSLPVEARVADLSRRLYACAEVVIHEHPEAWACWGYLDFITVPGATGVNGATT